MRPSEKGGLQLQLEEQDLKAIQYVRLDAGNLFGGGGRAKAREANHDSGNLRLHHRSRNDEAVHVLACRHGPRWQRDADIFKRNLARLFRRRRHLSPPRKSPVAGQVPVPQVRLAFPLQLIVAMGME